jgi:pimeloyl-ACP methyl ester carboxylesterase
MNPDPGRFIEVNGISLYVEEHGAGVPVLLMHGFPDSTRLWRNQVPFLVSNGFRVIAPDMRGFGRSGRPQEVAAYRLQNVMADVTGLLEAFGIEAAHVVGHDWGAAVSWLVASLAPQRVDRLVALSVGFPGAGGPPDLEALQKMWYRILIGFPGAEDLFQRNDWYLMRALLQGGGDAEQALKTLAEPGALTAAFNWYRANLPLDRIVGQPGQRPQLPPIQSSTLGVWSSDDVALTEKAMTESSKFVTGGWRYERIEGVGHWIPLDAADRLNELLLDFLG